MRKLASIQKIAEIKPIPDADNIVMACVLGWEVVVLKNEFKVGDLCIYCEIDSILPQRKEFEFLAKKKYRIKTIRLRGQISQGICFSLNILPESLASSTVKEGDNVTKALGVTKWEPNIDNAPQKSHVYPKWMPRWLVLLSKWCRRISHPDHKFNSEFPSEINKTDETRVQVLQPLLDKYENTLMYESEKLDGCSHTIYKKGQSIIVCSRNKRLRKKRQNKYWNIVFKHDLEKKLRKHFRGIDVVLQGELIGPGIQKNKYGLKEHALHLFNVYFPKNDQYASLGGLLRIANLLNIPTVPILRVNIPLSNNIKQLVEESKGKSVLADCLREGKVIRPMIEIKDQSINKLSYNRVSFKTINPEFLLKYDM